MPSAFDNIFAGLAMPTLFATFASQIRVDVRSAEAVTSYTIDAQLGRETVRRVRSDDGWKILRVREVLIAAADVEGIACLPDGVLRTGLTVDVDGTLYVLAGYDRAPGHRKRLTLERSDPSEISRPNKGGRR